MIRLSFWLGFFKIFCEKLNIFYLNLGKIKDYVEKALKTLNNDNENKISEKKSDQKEKNNGFLAFIASG